ncbi:MAG: hypothetical protein AAB486_00780 [Patescibacteria group bacterium]
MNVIHRFARRSLRIALRFLSRAVISKHRPDVIAVLGTGPTGIIREAVYTLLHEKYPARRNLESPESEFSVPLTILGSPSYPTADWQWLPLLFKIIRQWLTTKAYFHILILEMGIGNLESLTYWLEITKPKFLILSGENVLPKIINTEKTTVIQCPAVSFDAQDLYTSAIAGLGRYYRIPEEYINNVPKMVALPQSRISVRRNLRKQFILDASYYYYPCPLRAVQEVAEALPEPRAYVLERSLLKKEGPQIKDPVFAPEPKPVLEKYKTIVIRGPRTKLQTFLE